jgi:hypothetical protein
MDDDNKSYWIKFYKIKRIMLMIDEWGFYFLLLFLYQQSYAYWLILSILFYGGSAIYTSYSNLNKLERLIIPVEQDIWIWNHSIIQKTSIVYHVLYDYFSLKRQNVFHKE